MALSVNEREEIIKLHSNGFSMRKICEMTGFNRGTIAKVIRDKVAPIWYINMKTGEFISECVTIQLNKQHFYFLYHTIKGIEDRKKREGVDDIIAEKSLNVRLSWVLELNPRTTNRWLKESNHYIAVDVFEEVGDVLMDLYNNVIVGLMEKTYSIDDDGFVCGHKLNYINYIEKSGFAYYVNKKALEFATGNFSESGYLGMVKEGDFLELFTAKIGIQLGLWVRAQLRMGYKLEEIEMIMSSVERYTKIVEDYDSPIVLPIGIYHNTRGVELLPRELRDVMKEQLEDGFIIGEFDKLYDNN